MAEHENTVGESNEWYTPPEIFKSFGCTFDLDLCSPGEDHCPVNKYKEICDSYPGFVFCVTEFHSDDENTVYSLMEEWEEIEKEDIEYWRNS